MTILAQIKHDDTLGLFALFGACYRDGTCELWAIPWPVWTEKGKEP